ncbi:MAG: hypothetical protein ACI8ZX_001661 [Planctomycetota bacterium]|jgi:hypothetical protein
MKHIKKIVLLFLIAFSILNSSAFAQKSQTQKEDINLKIEYANNMIWHFNYNIRSLRNFQDQLKSWYETPNKKIIDIPQFNFISFDENSIKYSVDYSENNIFNYNFQLDKISKQILMFNLNCKKLENLTSPNSEKFREDVFQILYTIQIQSNEIAEISYDFSRACAINYRNEDYPIQLQKVKNVVSQAKNLILALRNNNKKQAQDYLNLLDEAMFILKSDFNIMELYVLAKIELSISELKHVKQNIYDKAFTMSSWVEQYLQSSFLPKGVNTLLQNTIEAFNEAEGKVGCASAFNTILNNSGHLFMLYTEEPNTLYAEKIETNYIPEIKENIDVKEPVKPIIKEKTPEIIISEDIVSEVKQNPSKEVIEEKQEVKPIVIPKEVFNNNDVNSLKGALPNNIIILMDVSASMKISKKLPVLKKSISHILEVMREQDILSLIAYSGEAQVLISGAKKGDKAKIQKILKDLHSSGGADLDNALDSAYIIGKNNFIENGNNKLIIASDGVFGVTFSIIKQVQEKSLQDFTLSVFQYNNGEETNNTKSLKYLSTIGKGSFRTITNNEEAVKAIMLAIKKESK